ncbi:baseplate assembly protein [Salmonella enterica]|uniref:Baseplate assembly protein n=2 Tax=Salmonella enterica I TaxID=59201 RepID=A0A5U3G6F7_SALET|nr:GPW/gp25 family protein [Salmonella enterica]EBH9884468.1 baseplate assembly protein [Salmonella enterica subsp. enterica serovar Kisarawe]EBP4060850.1 baseplate assembly protein [Salmonella enterica subsp. enterica]EBS4437389.1 baseplate assembly protein [Salmonella enterica subsp. enterica serovar Guinea]EDU6184715.1 baseplate assembly protein [Salmonella enterica subsp. houtenae serovar 44:z4,z23:-]EDV0905409.1 baseplate assembly protein [Salmonella enterica subsp. salamae]
MTARYTGMNPDNTGTLSDTDHLRNAVNDILLTPVGSRIMRREYGSLLPDLIDAPQNDITRLRCMSAAVIALTNQEPRMALNRIDIRWLKGGRAGVELSGIITETMQPVQHVLTLQGGDNGDR